MAVEYGLMTKDMKEKDLVKEISKQLELFFTGKSKYDIYKNHNLQAFPHHNEYIFSSLSTSQVE